MFVLSVIPLSRTAPAEPLSYRSRTKLAPGTIVDVPLRRKNVPGLVVECVPVAEAKFTLKSASYSLSKSSTIRRGALPPALLSAITTIATYHATTVGAVLAALFVPVLSSDEPPQLLNGSRFLVDQVEAPQIERLQHYRMVIQKGLTLLVVPTLTEANEWSELLKEFKPLVLTSKLSGKNRDAAIARAIASASSRTHRVFIVTPGFVALPVPSLKHIIIERMGAGSYSFPKRPYLDLRMALTELARAREIPITYGDYPLPLEYRANPEKPLSRATSGTISIYDSRSVTSKNKEVTAARRASHTEEEEKWHAVPRKLREEIAKTLEGNGRVAVLAVRRGYAPAVVCRDCGTTVTDEYGRNLSLSISGDTRTFRSADGKTVQQIQGQKILCTLCESWNLMPLGVGIERVEEELAQAFPKTSIVRIDADSTSAKARAATREQLKESGIIIGTELMLPWLSCTAPVDLAIIASADSLLALPFWRARERFVRLGLMLAERSKRTIIATRKPDDAVFTALTNPTTSTFWHDESALRKILIYPPFGTLIIFIVEGSHTLIQKARAEIRAVCSEHSLASSLTELPERAIGKNQLRATSVLQIPRTAWPDTALAAQLAHLSPNIRIHIDSEILW